MKMTRKKVWSAVITLLSIALGVIWLAPLIWLVGTALTETTFHMTFLPTTPFTLDNIKYVWNAVPFGQYYLHAGGVVAGVLQVQRSGTRVFDHLHADYYSERRFDHPELYDPLRAGAV